jgi:cytoskeletal protein CcmA (bactofilin family)
VGIVAPFLASLLLVLTPAATSGAELRQADAVVVAPGETIEDDLYAFGQTVTIHGTVTGDVIAAGQSVTVAGTVQGDLLAAGGSVVVAGPVNGTARLVGQTVEIGAPIGDDVLAAAETLSVGPRAPIGRDLLAGANAVTVNSPVARSIRAAAERLTIDGTVGGDVMAQAGTLRLASGAGIGGSLTYASPREAVVEPGAVVQGMTTWRAAEAAPGPAAQLGEQALAWLRTLVGLSVFGLMLVALFPRFMRRSTEMVAAAPWPSLGFGFAALVGVPVAAGLLFVAGLLIGGWWLGLLAVAAYLAMLLIGCAIAGLFLGRLVMRRAGRPGVASGWSLVAGLAVLGAVSLVPLVGGVAVLAAVLFGVGAGILTLTTIYREEPVAPGVTPPSDVPVERFGEPIPAR